MPIEDPIHLSVQLSSHWWDRLQLVAERCYASPADFIREVVEAEIVRRELLQEQQGNCSPEWLALMTGQVHGSRLQ